MRVMCIKDDWGQDGIGPKCSDVCHVIDIITMFGFDIYRLSEYPPRETNTDPGYVSTWFIPLSDEPEETESIKEPIADPCLS